MQSRAGSRLRVAIIVLAVLLGISLMSLAGIAIYRHLGTEDATSGTAPDNIITPEEKPATAGAYHAAPLAATVTRQSTKNEKLSLTEREPEDNTAFEVENMFPGDSETKYFNVTVRHSSAVTLHFHADIREGYEILAEVLECRVVLTDTDEELYSGLMRDMPESLDKALAATGGTDEVREIRYEITVSLPTSADNRYMNQSLVADLRWWIETQEEPQPPIVIVSPKPTDEPTPTPTPTEEPPEPTETPDTGDEPPKTGDDSNLTLWIVLAAVSLVMLILLLIKRKKEDTADEK